MVKNIVMKVNCTHSIQYLAHNYTNVFSVEGYTDGCSNGLLDGHHYDDKETKENTTCSTEKSRSLLGGGQWIII